MIEKYWQDPQIFRIGVLPDRAYLIPFEKKENCGGDRESSPSFQSLNGKWKFWYTDSIYQMEDFYENGFDDSFFTDIKVPSCWQTEGYDQAQYQSSPYTFIFDPPYVPEKNPAAAYCREFDVALRPGKRYELHFEGKDSCLYVWLNGCFVGYDQAPHNDAAFDVTPYLKNGANRLCALVLKYCDGSYLNDQDKIRLSGIFRDVYLLERAEKGIEDFTVLSDITGNIHISVLSQGETEIFLNAPSGKEIGYAQAKDGKAGFQIENPLLWSAETPFLYELIFHCEGEYISQKIGLREIAIQQGVFFVNGKPVKLYGVNRHDCSPDTGYVVSPAHIYRDLVLMKQHNINTIRTAHYPNDPRFYQLCDMLGFYIISEADVECHGGVYPDAMEKIVDAPMFEQAICDRVSRMYASFKNFSSIIIWSLGNESGWGRNLYTAAKQLKEQDPSRPIHYEGVFQNSEAAKKVYEEKLIPFESRMYPPIDEIKKRFAAGEIRKPFFLCEYSHAMGNSCGDLKAYDDLFQSDPCFMGGCIWEWCDHGLYVEKNGKSFLGYGGDFGEKHHLSNVCMDGLVSPERIPHSSLYEAKAVFSPLRFRLLDASRGIFEIENRYAFQGFSSYAFDWSIEEEGLEVEKGELELDIPPFSSLAVHIPYRKKQFSAPAYMNLSMRLKEDVPWAKKGFEIAKTQAALPYHAKPDQHAPASPVSYTQTNWLYQLHWQDMTYEIAKDTGMLVSIYQGGKQFLESPISIQCWRPPTDNDICFVSPDRSLKNKWVSSKQFGNIEFPEHVMKDMQILQHDGFISLRGRFLFGVQGRLHVSEGEMEYQLHEDGRLYILQKGRINPLLPYSLPRYGYLWHFSKEWGNIHYFGMGPSECYSDKCTHALMGKYRYETDLPEEQYEKPQESGSRYHTLWVSLQNSEGAGLKISGDFSFSASYYDFHEKARVAHQYELQPKNCLQLFTDDFMNGVGSASVGGQHCIIKGKGNPGDEIHFDLVISPIAER